MKTYLWNAHVEIIQISYYSDHTNLSYKNKVHDLLGQPWDNNSNAKTYEFPWISNFLDDLVMSYIWINQNPQNSEWLANTVLQKSRD